MSKKRKTRREKIIAASRIPSLNYSFETLLPELHIRETVEQTKAPVQTTAAAYAHVIKDIRYTIFATSLIAAINIILFILLKFQFVKFFGMEF